MNFMRYETKPALYVISETKDTKVLHQAKNQGILALHKDDFQLSFLQGGML